MKHLIFDCGGVLVWPRLGEWNMPFGAFEILGSRARDMFSSRYLLAHRQAVRWLDEAQLVPDVEAERRLRREYIRSMNALMDWRLTSLELTRLTDDFTDNINRYGLFEDADAMPSILKFMEQWNILKHFDAAVISTQIGAIKPDPRMYAAILEKLSAEPGECLFVDDRPDNLRGATAAGMKAVQMARPAFLPRETWDGPVVDSFTALNQLIEA